MKSKVIAGMVATLALMGGAAYLSQRAVESAKKAPPAHAFPNGFRVTGDPRTGRLCHKVWKCADNAQGFEDCRLVKSHFLDGRDFRQMSEAQAKAAIEADTAEDAKELGIAECEVPPDGILFRNALAQPHCVDCEPGCQWTTCPATFIAPTGNCPLGGTTCVVTVQCCGNCWPVC